MASYKLVALSNAVPGHEAAYDAWYTERHLGDVLEVPGVVSAQRLLVHQQLSEPPLPYKYLAIYDIETDDPQSVVEEITRRANTSAMPIPDSLAPDVQATVYRLIAERHLTKK